jgi:hypothetical protein
MIKPATFTALAIVLVARSAAADEAKQAIPNGEHDFSDKIIHVVSRGDEGKSRSGAVILEKARVARLGDRYFVVGRIPRDINAAYKPYEGQWWWLGITDVAAITEYDNLAALKKAFPQTANAQRTQAAAAPDQQAPDPSAYFTSSPASSLPQGDASHHAPPRFVSIRAFDSRTGNGLIEQTEIYPYVASEPLERKKDGRIERLRIVKMEYRYAPRRLDFTLKNDECMVYDAEGRKLSSAQAAKLLTPGKTVLVSGDGRPVASDFLQALKKEALILVLPRPDPQGNPSGYYPATPPVVP